MLSFKECNLEMTQKYYFGKFIVLMAWDSYIYIQSKNVKIKVCTNVKQKSKMWNSKESLTGAISLWWPFGSMFS